MSLNAGPFGTGEDMNAFNRFVDRRAFLEGTACATAAAVYGRGFAIAKIHHDDSLLDDLSHRCFQYFWDAIDPETGICRDLIHGDPTDNAKKGDESRGSTGVTGFALTALCIGAERKWISRGRAKDLVRRALRSYTDSTVFAINGWFYYFKRRSHRPALEGRRGFDQRLHLAPCRCVDLSATSMRTMRYPTSRRYFIAATTFPG
jgi:hypothetical protein